MSLSLPATPWTCIGRHHTRAMHYVSKDSGPAAAKVLVNGQVSSLPWPAASRNENIVARRELLPYGLIAIFQDSGVLVLADLNQEVVRKIVS